MAIVKTKFASDAICFDPDDFNGDGEEIEADIKVMTEQRNHKIWTVNRAQGKRALVPAVSLRRAETVSTRRVGSTCSVASRATKDPMLNFERSCAV